ncbi:MAG: SsgA family sporulation/cell division regulator [Actinomycetota bacterium]|nr:SsgA family sporulation/cell division regulator [Actinomycetota bacterium]
MTARPVSVCSEIQLRLVIPGSSALPVRAGLRYDITDPYAVQVSFHTGSDSDAVEWTFARSLLTDGVSSHVGDGDVQVWPATSGGTPVVCLSLSSPSGKALFELPLGDLADFLGRTYLAVPTGSESDFVDVEAELALLLWAEPET